MGEHGEWSSVLAREAAGDDSHLLNRDELWAAADSVAKLGYRTIRVPLPEYRKLVAAYDYWLVETGRCAVIPENFAYDSQDNSDRIRDRAGRLYDALVRLHDAQEDFKRKVADLRELTSRQQVQELVERYQKEIRS